MFGLYKSISRSQVPSSGLQSFRAESSLHQRNLTMSSQNHPSPPPAYINNRLGTSVVKSTPVAAVTRHISGDAPAASLESQINPISEALSGEKVDFESSPLAIDSNTTTSASNSARSRTLESRLEQVIQALECETATQSTEGRIVSRLEEVIHQMEENRAPKKHRDTRSPIKFKDAVGRKFSFPFYRCQTRAVGSPNSNLLW